MRDIAAISVADIGVYADVVGATASALAVGDVMVAKARLHPIAGELWKGHLTLAARASQASVKAAPRIRRNVTDAARAAVFRRDGFRCTYCGGRVVPRCVLVAISDVFPTEFAYHPNYRKGRIHPAYWALAPEADHTVAHSRGGSGVPSNLATLHTMCNARKSDSLLEDLPPTERLEEPVAWDGLLGSYAGIVATAEAQGQPHPRAAYHRRWMRYFDVLRHQ